MDRDPSSIPESSAAANQLLEGSEPRAPGTGGAALSRRSFLKAGAGALGALALLEASGVGFLFLRSQSQAGKFGGIITAGAIGQFSPGTVTEFPEDRFYLVRAPDGGFLAVHSRCPHLGCTVNWIGTEGRFLCPCHAATFDLYGNFEGPPVPRPLDTFQVHLEEGTVRVDTSQPRRRQHFSSDQLAYPPEEQLGRLPQRPGGHQAGAEG